jgi:hypothetical protein
MQFGLWWGGVRLTSLASARWTLAMEQVDVVSSYLVRSASVCAAAAEK